MCRAPLACLTVVVLFASGCLGVPGGAGDGGPGGADGSVRDGGGGATGNLTIDWSFAGASCDAAGLTQVEIEVHGQTDSTQRTVGCTTSGQGITIESLAAGSYDVTLTGLGTGGATWYAMSKPQTVKVNAGANTYNMDVPEVVGGLTVDWGSFGAHATCTDANVANIDVTLVDGSGNTVDHETHPCADAGAQWDHLAAGAFTVTLAATDVGGGVVYGGTKQVAVVAGKVGAYTVDLADNNEDLTVHWGAFGSSANCSDAGILDPIWATLTASTGRQVARWYYDCNVGKVVYTHLAPGTYTADLQVLGGLGNAPVFDGHKQVDVVPGQPNDYTIDLPYRVGTLVLNWTINGKTDCGAGVVNQVTVTIPSADGSTLDRSSYPCSWGGVRYHLMPAGERTVYFDADYARNGIYAQGSTLIDLAPGTTATYNVDMK